MKTERWILEYNDEDAMTLEWQHDGNWNKMMKIELEMHKEQVRKNDIGTA